MFLDDTQAANKVVDATSWPVPMPEKITAADIKTYLMRRYNPTKNGATTLPAEWVSFPEMRCGAGWSASANKYIDFWALHCFTGNKRIAYEIKISRTDFLKEIKKPEKRKMALFYSNQYYFITPKGMLKPAEIPAECGLIECWWINNQAEIDMRAKWNERVPKFEWLLAAVTAVEAPHRDGYPPTWNFVGALARRCMELEKEKVNA
jgi:hypothetical protein